MIYTVEAVALGRERAPLFRYLGAAEFSDRAEAMRACTRTFRTKAGVDFVTVRDESGEVVFCEGSTMKRRIA